MCRFSTTVQCTLYALFGKFFSIRSGYNMVSVRAYLALQICNRRPGLKMSNEFKKIKGKLCFNSGRLLYFLTGKYGQASTLQPYPLSTEKLLLWRQHIWYPTEDNWFGVSFSTINLSQGSNYWLILGQCFVPGTVTLWTPHISVNFINVLGYHMTTPKDHQIFFPTRPIEHHSWSKI